MTGTKHENTGTDLSAGISPYREPVVFYGLDRNNFDSIAMIGDFYFDSTAKQFYAKISEDYLGTVWSAVTFQTVPNPLLEKTLLRFPII